MPRHYRLSRSPDAEVPGSVATATRNRYVNLAFLYNLQYPGKTARRSGRNLRIGDACAFVVSWCCCTGQGQHKTTLTVVATFLGWTCHTHIVHRPVVPHHDKFSRTLRVKAPASASVGWSKLDIGTDVSSC